MSKDGTARGGARPGAGRKNKSIVEKMEAGNPGGRKLKVISLNDNVAELSAENIPCSSDLSADDQMPPIKEYMTARQKDGKTLFAEEIYQEMWRWLKRCGCEKLVMPQVIEQYAMASARLIHCEQAISEYGYLVKKANGSVATSPYVTQSHEYRKQANQLYYQIYQVVKENCTVNISGPSPEDDVMERLLRARKG